MDVIGNKKISVIVPVYNVEKYLEVCINSIQSQTYKNLEIILVDDGSTDNSGDMCDKYAKDDKRITVVHKLNGGLSDARNKGLEIATGEYISFIDSDDYISKEMYEKMLIAIQENEADYAICNFIQVDQYGKELIDIDYPMRMKNNELIYGNELLDKVKDIHNTWSYITVWTKLYHRKMFSNIRFPVGKINEDEFVFNQISTKNWKGVELSYIGYYYRRTENTITTGKFTIKNLALIDAYYERYEICRHLNKYENIVALEEATYRLLRKAYQKFGKEDVRCDYVKLCEIKYKRILKFLFRMKLLPIKYYIKKLVYYLFTDFYIEVCFRKG